MSSGPANEVVMGDPSLIEEGRIGLLVFTPESGSDAAQITGSPAIPGKLLGGNMPGAVIPADGPLARSMQLRATDGELIAFLDFAALPLDSQARFRSDVTRLAGAAQVAEERTQHNEVAVQFGATDASVGMITKPGLEVAGTGRRG